MQGFSAVPRSMKWKSNILFYVNCYLFELNLLSIALPLWMMILFLHTCRQASKLIVSSKVVVVEIKEPSKNKCLNL